ncbi:MAG: hypothetical protein NW226_25970 [Microscillaceae bacterium]|nr:hypothetical protein [Microscillaceae bacterium]
MNIFDTKYATVFLGKKENTIDLKWNGFVRDVQYNMVIDLVIQLISKHQIKTLIEDQTLLRLSENSKIYSLYELCCQKKADCFLESYILSKPQDNITARILAQSLVTNSIEEAPILIELKK